MGLGLQDVIVVALVAVALTYLVRRRRRKQPKPEIVTIGRAVKRTDTPSPPRSTPGE